MNYIFILFSNLPEQYCKLNKKRVIIKTREDEVTATSYVDTTHNYN